MRLRLAVGTAVMVAVLAGPAEASATRYAAPGGTSAADCQSVATACDLSTAIQGSGGNVPSAGEEVIIEPGSYSLGAAISEGASNLDIHGVSGQPRPVITQTDPLAILFVSSGTLSYLDLEGGSTDLVNQSGGVIERVFMRGAGNGQFTCQCGSGTIRDSVFVSTGPTAALGLSSNGGTSALTLRNVTAIATQSGTTAIAIGHQAPGAVTYDAYNTIARNLAGGFDVGAFGPNATITFHHSNYGTSTMSGGGVVQDALGDPHQSAAPIFANAAGTDFSEAPGSPTIDTGLTDPLNGSVDFAGNPRTWAGATDIGAYEFVPGLSFILGAATVKIKRSGAGSLPFSCTTPAPGDQCVVTGQLTAAVPKKRAKRAKVAAVGQVTGTVPAGGTGALLVKLSKKARKTLFAKGKMHATLSGVVTNALGTSSPLSAALALKPKGRPHR